jgi:DNA repair exonuclease SbcCD ATPase subunit
VLQEEERKLMT